MDELLFMYYSIYTGMSDMEGKKEGKSEPPVKTNWFRGESY